MQVVKLIEQFGIQLPFQPPFQLGKSIGDGLDGEVLELTNQPDQVCKLSVIYDTPWRPISTYSKIEEALQWIKLNQPPCYVPVLEHDFLGQFSRQLVDPIRNQDLVLYYYMMPRLQKISEDESKVFHTILSHEDRNLRKNLQPQKIVVILQSLSIGLDFDFSRITLFVDCLRNSPLQHQDLHPRNIMKDELGNFKLIDLDRIQLLTSEKKL